MALYLPSLLLLLLLALLSSASSSPSPPPTASSPSLSPPSPPPPSPSPPPPSPPTRRRSHRRHRPRRRHQPPLIPPSPPPPASETPQQFNNIIDALIGSGDFTNWVGAISSAVLPLSSTLFVPQNDAVNSPSPANSTAGAGDPFIFPYHVVPQRLSFADLQLFKTDDRLPTLLPGKSILITNNSRLNFTIDGSPIIQPDIYFASTVVVHGVGAVFDYSVYGDGLNLLPEVSKPRPLPNQSQVFRRPPPLPPANVPRGENSGLSSDAAPPCLCIEFPVVFVVFCGVLMFKIQRNGQYGR
ncbi:FAS1 domain containing protein [Parasponia andersonii]|uniref:FAS1 domain containing protein n=1 Tax=Parasponia andersonii TaxID=3476 RepID=A0A2P5CRE7_PARAD|nr:FAS1 domain containing protein [Parasponia andersonii]